MSRRSTMTNCLQESDFEFHRVRKEKGSAPIANSTVDSVVFLNQEKGSAKINPAPPAKIDFVKKLRPKLSEFRRAYTSPDFMFYRRPQIKINLSAIKNAIDVETATPSVPEFTPEGDRTSTTEIGKGIRNLREVIGVGFAAKKFQRSGVLCAAPDFRSRKELARPIHTLNRAVHTIELRLLGRPLFGRVIPAGLGCCAGFTCKSHDEAPKLLGILIAVSEAVVYSLLGMYESVGFGIGQSQNSSTPKANPFGVVNTNTTFASSPYTLPTSSGELFRPTSFSLQSPQPIETLQPTSVNLSGGFISESPNQGAAGFGQPAQIGAGQQVLGSVLGSFGQSRQIGIGLPVGSAAAPSSGFGGAISGGGFGAFSNQAGSGVFGGSESRVAIVTVSDQF